MFFACSNGGDARLGQIFELHLLRRSGKLVYHLAKNIYPSQEGSEWGGACFSPDGKTLFANLQVGGAVFAIWADDNKWGTIQ